MKTKLLTLLLCLCTLFLCNCSTSTEYKKVSLTKNNYDEYLAVNVYITDFSLLPDDSDADALLSKFHITATVNITTSPKKNYQFEDVEITYLHDNTESWNAVVKEAFSKVTANLDYTGTSHVSYAKIRTVYLLSDNMSYNYNYFLPQKNNLLVNTPISMDELIESISGYVLVPIE